jgi:AcrR family transcriptional regulator
MSAVAANAGVTRATLYRHFRNEDALFAACSAEWLAANPRPDIAAWAAIAQPAERLATALRELYAYNRATEQMRSNLLRDIDVVPLPIAAAISAFPTAMRDVLEVGWPVDGIDLRRAALGHAVAFETWRSLVREGLDDREAAALMLRLVTNATG